MSSYLFQEAKVGDVVDFCGHQLEVKRNQGHCPLCFFHKRVCSGVACLSWEREEGIPAYYKRITRKKNVSTNNHHPSPDTQQLCHNLKKNGTDAERQPSTKTTR